MFYVILSRSKIAQRLKNKEIVLVVSVSIRLGDWDVMLFVHLRRSVVWDRRQALEPLSWTSLGTLGILLA